MLSKLLVTGVKEMNSKYGGKFYMYISKNMTQERHIELVYLLVIGTTRIG